MLKLSPAQRQEHVASFDYLRILAAFCVVLLHVSAQNWDNVDPWSSAWKIFNLCNSATRWAVPVFLMMSGSIYLNPDRPLDLKKLWRIRIFRLFVIFVFWSGIYALDGLSRGESLTNALCSFFAGKYHMWYLPALAGLYILLPLIRKITETRKLSEYYLATTFCFVILFPRMLNLLKCLDISFLSSYLPALEVTLSNFCFGFGQICMFYFVLGHYLVQYPVSALSTRNCILLIIGGYLGTVVPNSLHAAVTGIATTAFLEQNGLNVLCVSVGVFQLVRNTVPYLPIPKQLSNTVHSITQTTFGIYLIHPLVLDRMIFFGLNTLTIHPVLAVPGITLLAFLLSWMLTTLLQRIPFVKDHLI